MLVSSIARFNGLKNNIQPSANSFNGVQNNNKPQTFIPFNINDLKSAIHKLNIFA